MANLTIYSKKSKWNFSDYLGEIFIKFILWTFLFSKIIIFVEKDNSWGYLWIQWIIKY